MRVFLRTSTKQNLAQSDWFFFFHVVLVQWGELKWWLWIKYLQPLLQCTVILSTFDPMPASLCSSWKWLQQSQMNSWQQQKCFKGINSGPLNNEMTPSVTSGELQQVLQMKPFLPWCQNLPLCLQRWDLPWKRDLPSQGCASHQFSEVTLMPCWC